MPDERMRARLEAAIAHNVNDKPVPLGNLDRLLLDGARIGIDVDFRQ